METPVIEENNWIPLSAFSVPPHEVKDLLEIAEAEMPHGAYAPFPEDEEEEKMEDVVNELQEEAEEIFEDIEEGEREDTEGVLTEEEDVHSLDETARFLKRQAQRYRLEKQAMKKQIREEQRRRVEALQILKHRYRSRLAEEKRMLKAQMANERQREMEKMEHAVKELVKEQQLHMEIA